jgi:aminopeptidase N
VTTESDYTVAATGVSRPPVRVGTRRRWEFVSEVPTATYLAAVHIGRYREQRIGRARFVHPAHLKGEVKRAFDDVPRMLTCFEVAFGPYPQEDCAFVVTSDILEIPLEAQGLMVFGANHLDDESARLIPHELAHQWFGNSVGVGAWRDIWLNEGFACFAEWIWSEASGGATIAQLAALHHARLSRLPQDLVLSDPGAESMFDDRVYKRGALLLEALRRTLGEASFGDLVRRWVRTHRHSVVSRRCSARGSIGRRCPRCHSRISGKPSAADVMRSGERRR